jgi:hypothetical protein
MYPSSHIFIVSDLGGAHTNEHLILVECWHSRKQQSKTTATCAFHYFVIAIMMDDPEDHPSPQQRRLAYDLQPVLLADDATPPQMVTAIPLDDMSTLGEDTFTGKDTNANFIPLSPLRIFGGGGSPHHAASTPRNQNTTSRVPPTGHVFLSAQSMFHDELGDEDDTVTTTIATSQQGPRVVYFFALLCGPLLIGVIVSLVFGLVRLRGGDDDSSSMNQSMEDAIKPPSTSWAPSANPTTRPGGGGDVGSPRPTSLAPTTLDDAPPFPWFGGNGATASPTPKFDSPRPTEETTEARTRYPINSPTDPPPITSTPRPVVATIGTEKPVPPPSRQPVQSPTSKPVATQAPTKRPTPRPNPPPTQPPVQLPTPRRPITTLTKRPTPVVYIPSPTRAPTKRPTLRPTLRPTPEPTEQPIPKPTRRPTVPTLLPLPGDELDRPYLELTSPPITMQELPIPSPPPTKFPSSAPSDTPSSIPSDQPSSIPTFGPSSIPSAGPTQSPSVSQTQKPSTLASTTSPTVTSSHIPTASPSETPSHEVTEPPTKETGSSAPSVDHTSGAPTDNLSSDDFSAPPSEYHSEGPSSDHSSPEPSLQASVEPSSPPSVPASTMEPTDGRTEAPTSVPTDGPSIQTSSPTILADIIYPEFRFQPWENLDVATQNLAIQLGYDASSWDEPGRNPLEDVTYRLVSGRVSPEAHYLLEQLGFTTNSWDCWVNHYEGSNWNELIQREAVGFYETLGWTRESWGSHDPTSWPKTDRQRWHDLTGEQRLAAGQLCYAQELWDEIELSKWDSVQQARDNFLGLLQVRSSDSLEAVVEDIDSPQHRAFLWMSASRYYWGYSADRIIQRWVLAVMALGLADAPGATGGNSKALKYWVGRRDECEEKESSSSHPNPTICNANGLIERIELHDAELYGTLPFELSLLSNSLSEYTTKKRFRFDTF